MQKTQVPSLGQEDPLEKKTATPSSILVRKLLGQRSLAGYNPWGHKRVGHDLATKQQTTTYLHIYIYMHIKYLYYHSSWPWNIRDFQLLILTRFNLFFFFHVYLLSWPTGSNIELSLHQYLISWMGEYVNMQVWMNKWTIRCINK